MEKMVRHRNWKCSMRLQQTQFGILNILDRSDKIMNTKEQLYYLIKHFQTGEYDINTFCDLFTTIYDIELDKSDLSETELKAFGTLEKYSCRFSPFEEDFKQCPNAFYDENTIKKQIKTAIKALGLVQ